MRDGRPLKNQTCEHGDGQLNVAETLAANFGFGDFDAAPVADDAAVLHALVLAAETFPVSDRAKNACAEKPSRSGLNVR